MRLLSRVLPFVMGSSVDTDDEHWKNFLLLLKIADILLAPQATEDEVAHLKTLIEEHHILFVELYPSSSVTPKIHSLIHMARLMMK